MDYQIRNFKQTDFPLISSWFKEVKEKGPFLEQLPEESTFILEIENKPMVLVSVFLTNANVAYMENMISNPSFKNRKEATNCLMNYAFNFAKDKGYKYAVGFTMHEKLAKRHLEMGWNIKINNVFIVGKELR